MRLKNYKNMEKELDHYYNQHDTEAWDIIGQVLDFHEGTISNREAGYMYCIMKYLLRFPYKGEHDTDLEKAKTYIDQLKLH